MTEPLLDDEALAYMRATQAVALPTPATLRRVVRSRTATGGTTTTHDTGASVMVRVDANPDEVPQVLAAQWTGGTLAKVTTTLDLDVRDGDLFMVTTAREGLTTTTSYEVVTDGEQDTWATAQIVWTRRLDRPVRGS